MARKKSPETKPEDTPDVTNNAELYKSWYTRITDALTREKTFRTDGKRVVDLYEQKDKNTPFAILYSNTETLQPAVYNARPIPIVDRRYKDADPLGKVASETGTRLLKFLLEIESEDYDNFDELITPGVLDGLLVNRGVTRFKYVADTEDETLKSECVFGESVRWDKFLHGYARSWKKVPWLAFEWDMSESEMRANFKGITGVTYDSGEGEHSSETTSQLTGVKLAKVYEVWDKDSRKVIFISPNYKKGLLKAVDDPLGLISFFPVPKPISFMRKVTTLVPTPLYIQYEQQAKELNEITTRLRMIIKALKVRGFYNSTISGIDKLLTAEDNEMIPVENMESMPEGSGVDKVLWLMPLQELSTTAQNLYTQREQVKSVIYEITGISDILRGASRASESATAQNIKNQWGTLRLRKMQKEVMRYCRDCLRIMLEMAVTKFSEKTVAGMTGLQYPTTEQKKQAQDIAQQLAQKAQQQQAMLPPPGMMPPGGPPQDPNAPPQPPMMPSGPPPPPPIPPQLQQILSQPSWGDILGLLKNDTMRTYRIDIETNSTIDAEASQDKQDISELLNALSQFLNGVGPLIQEHVLPFDVAKTMMLAIARRFTFGSQLEESIEQMAAPPPPPPPPPDPADAAKAQLAGIQLETAKLQLQGAQSAAQSTAAQSQLDAQIAQKEFENKIALMEQEKELKQMEMTAKISELGLTHAGSQMKLEQMQTQHDLKIKQMKEKAAATPTTGASNAS